MEADPLSIEVLFHIGPVPIARQVVTTWVIMAAMAIFLRIFLRAPKRDAGPVQAALEIVVMAIVTQLREVLDRDPWPYVPLLGSLFLFLGIANLSAILPGVKTPTGHIETPAALALIVFFSVHFYGLKVRGIGPYLRHYAQPTPFLLPLNILSEITRTFSLMIRLFGNMMSHEFIIAVLMLLAGLLLPIPFLLLGVLIGLIQAYIFTILASVYIAAGIGAAEA
ncbi:F0F1 ATP synthase subunit A [Pseudodonghicola flavimaris]|uniref:ATP synthase subunit a n=1 Tax=Pseudodonghicola flavimaris TaxID=3050036 RepID=A0ABT7F5R7_9RHOB|nr:F0F1 ATP synthase subunit A [Pseudodonghicola flavimaris]MDK3019948.1 F0F1 ATP synthase subunit A [Pseudodonghicola flavimaris]